MSDDIYEDELTAARRRRDHEAGVAVSEALREADMAAAEAEWRAHARPYGIALAEEAESSAHRLTRIDVLERALERAIDNLETEGLEDVAQELRVILQTPASVQYAARKVSAGCSLKGCLSPATHLERGALVARADGECTELADVYTCAEHADDGAEPLPH